MGNKTNVVYAVSPALVFGYDALNRATNMVDAVGASALTYNSAGLLATEDGPWASDTVTYTYANRLRTAFSLAAPNAPDWTQSYGYDSAKRLTAVTSPAGTFGYNYVGSCGCPAGSLVNRLTLPNGGYITNNFDGMARLMDTTLKNSGATALSSRAYTYNLASWRVSETRLDGSFVNYGYDNIGQLTNAVGKEAGGVTNRLHESYAYAYDKAGNLSARTNNALVQSFGVNSKNELTSVTRSGTLTVAGFTTASANSVTVNGNSATRYTDWTFAKSGFTVTNGNNTFTAVATDTLGRTDTNTSSFNLPATVSYVYDGNGNLTSDGTRGLDYDDENQLIRVTVTNTWKTEFVYDGQQRRRIRKEYIWQSSAWALAAEVRYIFDGNLEIQQRDANNLPILTLTRGRDLGGGLENAGGIGGLLARTENLKLNTSGTANDAHAYFFADGNGNVIALVNANQLVVAKYLYDSFGNVITSSGPLADTNTYRFSSKELHLPSGLIYFGRRFYDSNLQRWVNKDPKGIEGGINLFGYVKNSPLGNFDMWGLESGTSDDDGGTGWVGGDNQSPLGFCPTDEADGGAQILSVDRYRLAYANAAANGGSPGSTGGNGPGATPRNVTSGNRLWGSGDSSATGGQNAVGTVGPPPGWPSPDNIPGGPWKWFPDEMNTRKGKLLGPKLPGCNRQELTFNEGNGTFKRVPGTGGNSSYFWPNGNPASWGDAHPNHIPRPNLWETSGRYLLLLWRYGSAAALGIASYPLTIIFPNQVQLPSGPGGPVSLLDTGK